MTRGLERLQRLYDASRLLARSPSRLPDPLLPRAAPPVPVDAPWYRDVPRSSGRPALLGYGSLAAGILGFGLWSCTALIDGAVVSPGVFVATSQNKVIQHLEGGIIRDILVREGETVRQGQVLVRLDDTPARADLSRLRLRQLQLSAIEARLVAEAEGRDTATFPPDLAKAAPPATDVAAVIESQRAIFEARQRKLATDIAIQEQAIAALRHGISGDEARIAAISSQLGLVRQELAGKLELNRKGLVRTPELFAVQRLEANLEGEAGRLASSVGDNRERISAAREQIERLRNVAVQSAVEELNQTRAELKDVRERITAAHDVLSRVDIQAPIAGVVVKLNYHTPGGVIRPGNDILALLPLGEELVIECRIRPQDIDNVKIGQPAVVRLTALNQRTTPMVAASVTYLSADSLPNEKRLADDNGFVARIKLDGEGLRALHRFQPTPGMPAEVFIKTGQRTFLEYLVKPINDTMARAFREL